MGRGPPSVRIRGRFSVDVEKEVAEPEVVEEKVGDLVIFFGMVGRLAVRCVWLVCVEAVERVVSECLDWSAIWGWCRKERVS